MTVEQSYQIKPLRYDYTYFELFLMYISTVEPWKINFLSSVPGVGQNESIHHHSIGLISIVDTDYPTEITACVEGNREFK